MGLILLALLFAQVQVVQAEALNLVLMTLRNGVNYLKNKYLDKFFKNNAVSASISTSKR
jgi:hypothetical protein